MSSDCFAERLRQARLSRRITQTELSDSVGLGRNAVNYYETGKYYPTLYFAAEIADVLQVSLDWLMGRENAKLKPVDPDPAPISSGPYGRLYDVPTR